MYSVFFQLVVIGQPADPIKVKEYKLYAGIGLSNLSYHIYYKNPKHTGAVPYGYFRPISINLGCRLSKRASIQIGIAYGGKKEHVFMPVLEAPGRYVEYNFYSRTRVLAIPVTGRFVLFNAYKRLPIYTTISLMPAWGVTKLKTIESRDAIITTTSVKDTGINTFATAGFGLDYKIWKRFTGFAEVLLFRSNLTEDNSKYYDWWGENPKYIQAISSLGIGFNYNF